jgi:hypothetical protein
VRTQNACFFLPQILFFKQSTIWIPDRELGAAKWVGLPGVFTLIFLTVECGMALSTVGTRNQGVRLPEPELILYRIGGSALGANEYIFFSAPGNLLKEFRFSAYAAHKNGIIIPGMPPASS